VKADIMIGESYKDELMEKVKGKLL
jgi:hypothetical protein